MGELASTSMTPDRARSLWVNHLSGCRRCWGANGKRWRLCASGKFLKRREQTVSAAAVRMGRAAR